MVQAGRVQLVGSPVSRARRATKGYINLVKLLLVSSLGSPSTGVLTASYSFEDRSWGGPRILQFPGEAAPTPSAICYLIPKPQTTISNTT